MRNNVKFKLNKTMTECLYEAYQHIHRCIDNETRGVRDLDNKTKVKNRIIEYAKMYYVEANYWVVDRIECQARAYHYGVPMGTEIKHPVSITSFTVAEQAKLLNDFRNAYNTTFNMY